MNHENGPRSAISGQKLEGIIPPMVTPLRSDDELDHDGLERLIEHILAGGVHGLFLLGTTGEAPGLSYRLRQELIDHACRQVALRVPVLVGITDTSVVEMKKMAEIAAKAGARGVVAAPPYYYPNSQPELLEYLRLLAAELPLPLYLYNMPTHTKTFLEVETIERLLELPNIAGVKDSSGNMTYFHRLLQIATGRPDWSVLVGPEELLAESVLLGGHGGVCGGANLFPKLYVDLYYSAKSQDIERIRVLHGKVMRLSSTLYHIGRHGSSFIRSLKSALRELDLCDDFVAAPFRRFEGPERKLVCTALADLEISV